MNTFIWLYNLEGPDGQYRLECTSVQLAVQLTVHLLSPRQMQAHAGDKKNYLLESMAWKPISCKNTSSSVRISRMDCRSLGS